MNFARDDVTTAPTVFCGFLDKTETFRKTECSFISHLPNTTNEQSISKIKKIGLAAQYLIFFLLTLERPRGAGGGQINPP